MVLIMTRNIFFMTCRMNEAGVAPAGHVVNGPAVSTNRQYLRHNKTNSANRLIIILLFYSLHYLDDTIGNIGITHRKYFYTAGHAFNHPQFVRYLMEDVPVTSREDLHFSDGKISGNGFPKNLFHLHAL